jgi:hypothetical protein
MGESPVNNDSSCNMSDKKSFHVSTAFDPAHLQKALDASGTGVWEINLISGKACFSARARQIFCFEEGCPDNWLDPWKARIHPADRERVLSEFTTASSSPSGRMQTTYRFLHGDGSCR